MTSAYSWHIHSLVDACHGQVYGASPNLCVSSFAIDSRKVQQGDMFIALKTDSNDGHKYIQQAVDKGAVCVLVEKFFADIPIPQIVVKDTLQALTDMGIHARTQFKGTVIGVTGSVGKTSVKDTLCAVLSQFGKTQGTVGNLNNHLGVPLSLLAIAKDCMYAVIEMGMSAGGEMRHLTHIARPHVAIVTAVDVAHLESFTDTTGIAHAKSEIFEGLTGDKIALYNGNSLHADILQQVAQQYANTVHVYAQDNILSHTPNTNGGQSACVRIEGVDYDISLPTLGVHRIINAVGVLSVVRALGVSMTQALDTLKKHLPSAGRGRMHTYQVGKNRHIHIFDETYNSSPASLQASLQVLCDTPTKNRRIAVLGDMLELGADSTQLHADIYNPVYFKNIHMIFLCGDNMHHLYGCILNKKQVFWCDNIQALYPRVLAVLQNNDVVLVKGSRGMQMEILLQHMQKVNKG